MNKERNEMDKGFEISINFLLYSYFKITLESESDTIIEKAIDKAYFDATNRAAFNALEKTNFNSDDLKSKGTTIIKEGINKIIEQPLNFDKIHNDMCVNLIKKYENVKIKNKDETAFSYGNAQKWVNMTMKYLYVIGNVSLNSEANNDFITNYAEKINEFSNKIHIPVDSYIIEAIWKGYNIEKFDKNNLPEIKTLKDGSFGTYSSEKVRPWSKWDNAEEYTNFQKSLRKAVKESPIEWEGSAWIEIAQKRNKQ